MDGRLSAHLARHRLRIVAPYLRGKVLDFGCGQAEILRFRPGIDYVGVDHSPDILALASARYPNARFLNEHEWRAFDEVFDTVMSIATIGLLSDPREWLKRLERHLSRGGQIVLTTPDPRVNGLHRLGGRLGLFSRQMGYTSAKQLPNRQQMADMAAFAGLRIVLARRFMLGANQLFILMRESELLR